MKNMKKIALAASVIAALGLTTAYAAESTDAQTIQKKDVVEYHDKNISRSGPGLRNVHKGGPGQSFKILAELTGKNASEIQEACRQDKINPAQYANKIGKYKEFKSKLKAIVKENMKKQLDNGKITKEQYNERLKNFDKRLDDARDGKRPPRPMGVLPNDKGPQGDVIQVLNPDGSVAQGHEGMAFREHPMYGKMPFDTLANLTGRTSQNLYAEAYKDNLTGAGLAKKLGIFEQYKAERLATHKTMMDKAVADGKMTQEQETKALENLGKRIDAGMVERRHMGPPPDGNGPRGPRTGYGPNGPVVNKNS